jgi:hypothetical protein
MYYDDADPLPCGLCERRWDVDGVGAVSLQFATRTLVATAQREWPSRRPWNASNRNWDWISIMAPRRERFAVLVDGSLAGLWCDNKRPIQLREGPFYRLDYFEVDPGYFALCLIATRALELRAFGVVLASLPEGRAWYETHGAEPRLADGWKVEAPDLVPFVIAGDRLSTMRDHADAHDADA